jgi:uncharacterized membrane protein YkoI
VRSTSCISGLAVLALALPLAGFAGGDHERARRLVESGDIQPLAAILERARAEQPGRVLEVAIEGKCMGWHYEVEILDAAGRVWELTFDARSGELLTRRSED